MLTLEAVVGLVTILQVAVIAVVWVFKGRIHQEIGDLELRLVNELNGKYVRTGECVLRDGATRELLKLTADEGRSACLAAAGRDAATQDRIDEIRKSIAREAADAILRSQRLQEGIAELLARK